MDKIVVFRNELPHRFEGEWLVCPNPDFKGGSRTSMTGFDAGTFWGVAQTKHERIVVTTAHCNGGFLDDFVVFEDWNAFDESDYPADIRAKAAFALGLEYAVDLDI